MNQFIIAGLLFLATASCKQADEPVRLKTGTWRAAIDIQGQELPFNFQVDVDKQGGYDIYLINAEERLLLDEVTLDKDSVTIALHIFDADIRAKVTGDSLHGVFIKNYEEDYRLPFKAAYNQEFRFVNERGGEARADFSGKYEVTFRGDTDTTKAVAVFRQSGSSVTGTFLTPTGDYRYLDGMAADSLLQVSTFDGNHAYLFRAFLQKDGSLRGEFFSGKTRRDAWVAVRNEDASLPDAAALTYMKEGYERITFNFPDVDGDSVSLNDDRYKDKVVILQIFGTWCPNCMDETAFLAPWYRRNKDRGVEVIGLAYERKNNFSYARERIKKMMSKMDIPYQILIAGTNDKEMASKTLPMLNAVLAFPTTIFIGKDGKVKKIHTGFNGPGTGIFYDRFKEDFNQAVNALLDERLTAQR
jgi:thiol-disulfide isomerase/thioredoxin